MKVLTLYLSVCLTRSRKWRIIFLIFSPRQYLTNFWCLLCFLSQVRTIFKLRSLRLRIKIIIRLDLTSLPSTIHRLLTLMIPICISINIFQEFFITFKTQFVDPFLQSRLFRFQLVSEFHWRCQLIGNLVKIKILITPI